MCGAHACVFVAHRYPLCALCLQGMRGDPCATGVYNRPAGLAQCNDKTLGVLCNRCVFLCLCVCRMSVSQQAVLHKSTGLWEWRGSH